MLSIFLLTKQVLLKTIVIVVGKLIRNRVLWGGGGGNFVGPQGAGMGVRQNYARRE